MLFQTKRGTKFSRKPRNAQMPFTDPVISLKISSSGGTDFPKTPENAQSGRAAEVQATQQKSGPHSRSPGRAAEVRASGTSFRTTEQSTEQSTVQKQRIPVPHGNRDALILFYTSSSPLQIRLPDFRSKSMTFGELKATFTLVPILKMSEPKTTPVRRKSPTRIFRVVSIPVGMTP